MMILETQKQTVFNLPAMSIRFLCVALHSLLIILCFGCDEAPDGDTDTDELKSQGTLSAEQIMGTPFTDQSDKISQDLIELCSKPDLTYYEAQLFFDTSYLMTDSFTPVLNTLYGYLDGSSCLIPCEADEDCTEKASCTTADGLQIEAIITDYSSSIPFEITLHADETVFGWSYIAYKDVPEGYIIGDETNYDDYQAGSVKTVEWQGKPFENFAADSAMSLFSATGNNDDPYTHYEFSYNECELEYNATSWWDNEFQVGASKLNINGNIWEKSANGTLSLNGVCFSTRSTPSNDCEYTPSGLK